MDKILSNELSAKLLESMRGIMRYAGMAISKEMEECDVTWPQFHLLKTVRYQGRIPVTSLSNRLMIAAPTASRMINGLCSKGLLEKEKDSIDQRITHVKATGSGLRLTEKLDERLQHVLTEMFEHEDIEEVEKSVDCLSRVADRWSAAEKRSEK